MAAFVHVYVNTNSLFQRQIKTERTKKYEERRRQTVKKTTELMRKNIG